MSLRPGIGPVPELGKETCQVLICFAKFLAGISGGGRRGVLGLGETLSFRSILGVRGWGGRQQGGLFPQTLLVSQSCQHLFLSRGGAAASICAKKTLTPGMSVCVWGVGQGGSLGRLSYRPKVAWKNWVS